MTKYENAINKLQEQKQWRIRKTTGDKYLPDGVVLSVCKGRALLTVVLHDEHTIEIGRKKLYSPPSYFICHQQNVFKGEIRYEHNLETEKDYDDFMYYVEYHYNHLTRF